MDIVFKFLHTHSLIITTIILGILGVIAYLTQAFLNKLIKHILSKHENLALITKYIKVPIILLSLLFIVYLSISFLNLPKTADQIIKYLLVLSTILLVSWLLISLIALIRRIILLHYDIKSADNLLARKVHTQFRVIERVANIFIVIITFAAILMIFEPIRQVGISILASAGLLTAIIGFAAQQSLSSILAGVQIAITQPIRIDDVVIVENEWGIIEEINLSYVVMRIWDKRRLIIPINYFLQKPFQNWSHNSTDLLGTVFIYTDPSVPVDKLRQQLDRVVKQSPLWDGVACLIHMTDVKNNIVELRLTVSALNAPDLFNLRCLAREKLMSYIALNYPESLPQTRLYFERDASSKVEKNKDLITPLSI